MDVLEAINAVLWHDYVLFTLLGVGVLFTFWARDNSKWQLHHQHLLEKDN